MVLHVKKVKMMVIHIHRSLNYPRTFTVLEHPELTAKLKCFEGDILNGLQIYEHGQLLISVNQDNFLRKLTFFVAFLWPEIAPLSIFKCGECIGHSVSLKHSQYIFVLQNSSFKILLHTKNYFSIWKNEEQVALLHTDGAGKYEVKYDSFDVEARIFLLMFCAIIECFNFEFTGHTHVYYFSLGKDDYESAIDWLPHDNQNGG